jgi:hypothetical protein
MSAIKPGEWMWRFLAAVMLFAVCWTVWIIYQLNPPALIMNAAFEAAAKARANGRQTEKQSAHGVIAPPAGAAEREKAADASPKAADAVSAAATPPAPETPKEPPINPDKLKFSDTIALPVPNAKK